MNTHIQIAINYSAHPNAYMWQLTFEHMDSCIAHSLVSDPAPVTGVFVCSLKCQTFWVCVCVCVNIFIAKGVVTHKCECVCQRVCGEGVINHDLNVDVARYETSCSRHHLRQLLPYTSQPPSHFTYALINRGKCKWINIVRPLMLQIMEHSTLIWNICVTPGTWLEKLDR